MIMANQLFRVKSITWVRSVNSIAMQLFTAAGIVNFRMSSVKKLSIDVAPGQDVTVNVQGCEEAIHVFSPHQILLLIPHADTAD